MYDVDVAVLVPQFMNGKSENTVLQCIKGGLALAYIFYEVLMKLEYI